MASARMEILKAFLSSGPSMAMASVGVPSIDGILMVEMLFAFFFVTEAPLSDVLGVPPLDVLGAFSLDVLEAKESITCNNKGLIRSVSEMSSDVSRTCNRCRELALCDKGSCPKTRLPLFDNTSHNKDSKHRLIPRTEPPRKVLDTGTPDE